MLSGVIIACLTVVALATPAPQRPVPTNQPIPATGENGKPSGIFGFGDVKPEEMLFGGGNANKGGTGKIPFICSSASLLQWA
jgi:hypothetical protein